MGQKQKEVSKVTGNTLIMHATLVLYTLNTRCPSCTMVISKYAESSSHPFSLHLPYHLILHPPFNLTLYHLFIHLSISSSVFSSKFYADLAGSIFESPSDICYLIIYIISFICLSFHLLTLYLLINLSHLLT